MDFHPRLADILYCICDCVLECADCDNSSSSDLRQVHTVIVCYWCIDLADLCSVLADYCSYVAGNYVVGWPLVAVPS